MTTQAINRPNPVIVNAIINFYEFLKDVQNFLLESKRRSITSLKLADELEIRDSSYSHLNPARIELELSANELYDCISFELNFNLCENKYVSLSSFSETDFSGICNNAEKILMQFLLDEIMREFYKNENKPVAIDDKSISKMLEYLGKNAETFLVNKWKFYLSYSPNLVYKQLKQSGQSVDFV